VAHIEGNKNAYRQITERGRPPGRLGHSWKGKMDLSGIEWDGVNWFHLP
jgi:hypothetical protein